jgi:Domain of unknown function DUF11
VVASGDLLSGNVMQYNVTVINNGPRWAYGSQVSFAGTNGLIASGGSLLTYNILAPGSSQTLSLFINKSAATSSGIITSTATFTLADPTINDTATGNNTAIQNPVVR